MRSSVIKRSVLLSGRKTSVSLEDAFWTRLKELAVARGTTVSALVTTIDQEREHGNLSSAIRLFVLESFRDQARAKRRVLVVDDDPDVLEITAGMLEDLGCDARTASTGAEAITKLKTDRLIDILITDINMPGMSGYELAQHARQIRANLHVILLSGRETDAHGLPLIRKPFLQPDLKRVMSQTSGLC
jgi:two-component system cell cycle response regulator CpdR